MQDQILASNRKSQTSAAVGIQEFGYFIIIIIDLFYTCNLGL